METGKTSANWKTYALLALTIGVVATVTVVFALAGSPSIDSGSGNSSSTSSGSVATTTLASPTLGIALVLSVTPSQGPLATTFDVNATVVNTLSQKNNVTGVDDYHGVQFNPLCNTGPVTFEVLQGYYTATNFTAGSVLSIHGVQNMMCMVPTSALSYYVFQPNSDKFTGPLPQPGAQGATAAMTTRAATASASLVDVYSNSLADPAPFPQGTYTVVAADNWGQLAVVHFTVTPA